MTNDTGKRSHEMNLREDLCERVFTLFPTISPWFYLLVQIMSPVHHFRSAPVTDPDASFKFVVYGDMGITAIPGAHDTAKYMVEEAENGSSFVFHIGDISYAVGIVRNLKKRKHPNFEAELVRRYATENMSTNNLSSYLFIEQ